MALVDTSGEVVELALADLRYGPKVRQHVDIDHVSLLAAVLDRCPPIIVQAGTMAVVDGGHRFAAAKRVDRTTIRAVVVECDDTEAWRIAVSSGSEHGKPLTLAERKVAARHFVTTTDWSDRRIADECAIDRSVVAALRPVQPAENRQLDTRKGKDDKARPTDPAASRDQVATLIGEKPNLSDREIALRLRVSPTTVGDVRRRVATSGNPQPPKLQAVPLPAPDRPVAVGEVVTFWPAKGSWKRHDAAQQSNAARDFCKWMDRTMPPEKKSAEDAISNCPASLTVAAIEAARSAASFWTRFADDLIKRGPVAVKETS